MNYIIISPAEGTSDRPIFWRAKGAGYTYSPFVAGIYTEEQIQERPDYYNNGYTGVAIPLTDAAMEQLGFKCSYVDKKLVHFFQTAKK